MEVKNYVDSQKDTVTQFETSINFLKKQAKLQKKELEESNLQFKKDLETYRLENLRKEKDTTNFSQQIDSLLSQVIDIEQRFIVLTREGA